MIPDRAMMIRAIQLATRNLGKTGDNPSVGCVIVLDGRVVGEGATAPGGRPHAEELALGHAGDQARGAVAYVTLEPCARRSSNHVSCSQRLIAAGVKQVFIACSDPSHMAAGAGTEAMLQAGLEVQPGVLTDEAQFLYRDYQPARPTS
jgi:pyrimidine deaminase RibD-like protein